MEKEGENDFTSAAVGYVFPSPPLKPFNRPESFSLVLVIQLGT